MDHTCFIDSGKLLTDHGLGFGLKKSLELPLWLSGMVN